MFRAAQKGISLIELMVVVAVATILAGIAYPSYQGQVRKSRRAAAEAFLMDVAARQQQRLVDVRSFADSIDDLNLAVPADLAGFYALEIDAPTPRTFAATMTAVGAQAKDAACKELSLDNTGHKEPASCW